MRKGLGMVAWVAFVILILAMTTQCDSPLGPSYVPRHDLLELVFLGGALYIFATYLVARAVSHRMLVRALFVQVGLFTATVAAWWIYHVRYGTPPMVQDWDSYVRVTPFHEQLALPAFIGLLAGPAIIAVALRRPPPAPLGPLTS